MRFLRFICSGRAARSNNYVPVTVGRLEKRVKLRDRGREISIGEQDQIASCGGDTSTNCSTFAAVDPRIENHEVSKSNSSNQIDRVIRRAIVGNDDLELAACCGQVGNDRGDRGNDSIGLVEGRDNHR